MSDLDKEARGRIVESLLGPMALMVEDLVGQISPHCESPIEVMLATALLSLNRIRFKARAFSLCPRHEVPADGVVIIPQYEWAGYRIDFCFRIPTLPQPLIFLECDGHDFHERTKQQAERDKSRDRAIQSAGIPILRFTGSEIYRDPAACAYEIIGFVTSKLSEVPPRKRVSDRAYERRGRAKVGA